MELIPATALAVRELAVVVLRSASAVRRRGARVLVCRVVGPRALALVGLLSAAAITATLLVVVPAPEAPSLGGASVSRLLREILEVVVPCIEP